MSASPYQEEGGGYIPRGSTPARRMDPRARRGPIRSVPDEMPTLGEIERRLMRIDDELADLVEDHFRAAEEAAEAEADWKNHRDKMLLRIANAGPVDEYLQEVGRSQDLREAYAKGQRTSDDPKNPETGHDLYRLYKILESREKSIDRALRAIQARGNGLMSVARGIRGVT